MTREETTRILERVCRLYVTQARKLTREQKAVMINTWADELRHDSYTDVDRAVNSYMKRGKPFMPDVVDIVNILSSSGSGTQSRKSGAESDRLFDHMVEIADSLANKGERQSIIDPGGYRWSEEHQRNVYYHPEIIVSRTSFTQYDFAQLPIEIREYVEDVEGLRNIWREVQSNRDLARRRFEAALPEIRAEIARRSDRNIKENRERAAALFAQIDERHAAWKRRRNEHI